MPSAQWWPSPYVFRCCGDSVASNASAVRSAATPYAVVPCRARSSRSRAAAFSRAYRKLVTFPMSHVAAAPATAPSSTRVMTFRACPIVPPMPPARARTTPLARRRARVPARVPLIAAVPPSDSSHVRAGGVHRAAMSGSLHSQEVSMESATLHVLDSTELAPTCHRPAIVETNELAPTCHRPEIIDAAELAPTCHRPAIVEADQLAPTCHR